MSAETPERPVWADAPLRPRRAGRDAAAEHPEPEAPLLAPDPDAATAKRDADDGPPEPDRAPRARGPVNVLAVVALLLGIMLSPLAALFGHIAVGQIARSRRPGGRDERGMRAAGAAIALGWLSLAALIVAGVAVAIALQGGP